MADVIKFKGEFDTSKIMSAIKQMRAELSKNGNSALFGNLDKEIAKLEGLGNTIQAQMSKGFASSKEFKTFEANVSKLELEFEKIGNSFDSINADNLKNNLKKISAEITSMQKEAKNMANAFKTAFATDTSGIGGKATKLSNEIAKMAEAGKSYEEAQKRVSQVYDELLRKQKSLTEAKRQELAAASVPVEVGKSGLQRRQFTSGGQNINADQLSFVNETYRNAISGSTSAKAAIEAFTKSLAAQGIEIKNISAISNTITNGYNRYTEAVKTNKAEVNKLTRDIAALENEEHKLVQQQNEMNAAMAKNEDSYRKAAKAANEVTDAEKRSVQAREQETKASKEQQSTIDRLKNSIGQETNALKQGTAATGDAVQSTERLNTSLDSLKSRVAYLFSLGNAFYQVKKALTDTFNDVKNIDKAFASIAMVTEKTISGLWEHYGEYASMAQKLGQSTESAIKASALFYQQGLKDAEVMQLTEDTMRLATLAGLDFEKATSQMTAALRGFHMEMDQGAHITDVYSELAAHAAADVNGIAYAMSKTASIANNAGMSFENTAAFLTQMIETTQEAPENIGTAMKTIIARFTELKENVAGTAESEFDDLDYNKVDKALKTVGISIKDATGQFRNLDEVFLELSSKWDTLDRNSQRYIATIAAGSRQQSRFIAMMEDYDRVMELVTVTQESQGRSQKQFEKNADSIQFKIQQLKTAWEQFRLGLADSEVFKKVIDMLTKFVDTLNKLDFKQLLTLGVIGATLGKQVVTNFIDQLRKGSGSISRAWEQAMSNATKRSFSEKFWGFFSNKQGYMAGAQSILGFHDNNNKITAEQVKALEQQIIQYANQLEILNQKREVYTQKTTEALEGEIQKTKEELQLKMRELGIEKDITEENAKQISQALQENSKNNPVGNGRLGSQFVNGTAWQTIGKSAASAAITTALMTALSGADLGTVLKTSGITALTAAIPGIIQAIMPTIAEVLTGPVGITVLIGTILVSITAMIANKIKEVQNAELERLASVDRANEELRKKNEELIITYQKAQTATDKATEARATVEDLGNKKFLTPSEKKRYEEAGQYLADGFEDAVEFDEANNHYEIIESKMDTIIAELQGDEQKARTEFYQNGRTQLDNIAYRRETLKSDLRFANNRYAYLRTESDWQETPNTVLNEYRSYLKRASKTYGDEIDLDSIFGIKGFTEKLFSNGDMTSFLNNNNVEVQDLIDSIDKLDKTIDKLNDVDEELVKRSYVEQGLQMQGWDAVAAGIAAAAIGKDVNVLGGNSAVQQRLHQSAGTDAKTALSAISQGSFSSVFGADAAAVERAFAQLGYGGEGGQKFSELFSSGTNLKKWGDLSKELRDALSGAGYKEQYWNGDIGRAERTKAKDALKALTEVLAAQMIQDDEFFSDEIKNLFDGKQGVFTGLSEVLGDYTDKGFLEYQKALKEYINKQDPELQQALWDYVFQSENSPYNAWKKSLDTLSSYGISRTLLEKIDQQGIEELNESLASFTDSQLTAYAKMFNEQLAGADANVLNILSEVDLTRLADIGAEDAKEYIDKLTEATGDAEKAQEYYNNYIRYVSRLTGASNYYGKGSVEILRGTTNEYLAGLPKSYEDISKAYKAQSTNGSIDQATYYKLIEGGFGDYVTQTGAGYKLLTDSVEKMWSETALSAKTHIDDLIDYQTDAIDYAAQFMDKQFNNKSIDTIIAQYKVLKDEGKDTTDVLKDLDAETAAFVELVAGAGYASIEKYIVALKDGKLALKDLSEETYYNALVSIAEAFTDAKDKVNELKDKVEEAQKSIDKAAESLEEANQKLYEAQHGTELFKSSLDGLINYQTKLKGINNAIDDIKDSLKDVASAEEATTLFSGLGSNYDSKTANLSAQNVVLNDALSNLKQTLTSNYGDYIKFIGDELQIDFAYLNMDANDNIRKALEDEAKQYQSYLDNLRQNNKEIKNIKKEREEFEKQNLKNYTDIQNDVIDVLKNAAEEEVNITKDKYDALKEADNDYISALEDAIKKQQDLRNREKDLNELATKEKKLSLLQRDTSGANAKDVLNLEKDIQESREKLLDDSVQSIIDNLKELYEDQAEARDKEIEYMEAVTENAQYFSEWAQNIMATWQSVDDMQDWFLSNDKSVEDMTVEQTELYIKDIEDKWTDLITYQGFKAAEFQENTDSINAQMTELYNNTSENISNIGTFTQETYQKAAEEAEKAALKAQQSAQESYDEAVKKLQDAQTELAKQEQLAVEEHEGAMDTMVKASKSALENVATFAAKTLLEWSGEDINDSAAVKKWASENGLADSNGNLIPSLYAALEQKGANMSDYSKQIEAERFRVTFQPTDAPGAPSQLVGVANSRSEAEALAEKYKNKKGEVSITKAYKKGGLVDYTGLAQVDGTPSKPEAFLDETDTPLLAGLVNVLHYLDNTLRSNAETPISASIGDTAIEININIDNIADDYSVDQLLDRIQKDITDAAAPTGTPVILRKK